MESPASIGNTGWFKRNWTLSKIYNSVSTYHISMPSTAVYKERFTVFLTVQTINMILSCHTEASIRPRPFAAFHCSYDALPYSSRLHASAGTDRVSLTSTTFLKPNCCQFMLGRITWISWYSAICERHLSFHQYSILIRLPKNTRLANSQRHSLTASRQNTRATALLASRSVFSPCWELILC
jgi:hypothetical protein